MSLVKPIKIDENDRKIITLLETNAKISQDEIARQIKLSRPTVQKRIKNLEDNQIIKFTIQTNAKKLGKEITAFILVILDRAQRVWEFTYNELQARMNELEIMEIHHIAGHEDVILKLKTRNIDSLESILINVSDMKGVARTRTLICLSSLEPEFEMPRNY